MPKGIESADHKLAKSKLFQLLKDGKVEIFDKEGVRYDIYTGVNKNEFLHSESPVLRSDKKSIYSNENSSCKILFEKYPEKNPHCDLNGHYGAFEQLPCIECLKENYLWNAFTKASKFISFRPDIAFGYNGEYKIWIEIKKTHACSYRKKQFCYEKGIVLLEVNADEILNCGDKLICKRMVFKDKSKTFDELENELLIRYQNKLNKNGYIKIKEVKKAYFEKMLYKSEDVDKDYFRFVDTNFISYTVKHSAIRNLLGLRGNNHNILIDENKLDSYTQIISEYDDYCSDLAEGIFKYMCNKVKECEYILFSGFKENCVRLLPNGYKSVYSGTINKKLRENGVYQIHNSDAFASKLREIGIDVGKRHIIVNKQMYEKIKSIGYDK